MQDFGINTNYELLVARGDWAVVVSDAQHQALLLMTQPGEWKENPGVGVGAVRFAESETPDDLLREIRQQFSADGMDVQELRYNELTGKLMIYANYRTT